MRWSYHLIPALLLFNSRIHSSHLSFLSSCVFPPYFPFPLPFGLPSHPFSSYHTAFLLFPLYSHSMPSSSYHFPQYINLTSISFLLFPPFSLPFLFLPRPFPQIHPPKSPSYPFSKPSYFTSFPPLSYSFRSALPPSSSSPPYLSRELVNHVRSL